MKVCNHCQHYLSYDPALAGEDPWMALEHARLLYTSTRGCEVCIPPVKQPFADLAASERCVCDSLARRINQSREIVLRGRYVIDPDAVDYRRQYQPIEWMEYQAMVERAEYCPSWLPRRRF
jgi:hypothetical protein